MLKPHKNLLNMDEISREEIKTIFKAASAMKEICLRDIKKVPTLRGKTIMNLFFEPSTRTKSSFEVAEKRLSADTINFSASSSSITKGETLIDTAKNLQAMNPDAVVIRHPLSGAPDILAAHMDTPVINAGDGMHEHPTQALLDMFTIIEKTGGLQGLRISIIGDITHSRVARSDVTGMTKMGADVTICGPPTMIPPGMEELGAKVTYDINKALDGADVVIMLRLQLERQKQMLFPSTREYSRYYGLTSKRLANTSKDIIIMHPGPVNRGVEISSDVADGPWSLILNQVNNGVAVRMAILYLYVTGDSDASFA